MKPSSTVGSFEGTAKAHRLDALKLTLGQRINRSLELTEAGRALAKGMRAKKKPEAR